MAKALKETLVDIANAIRAKDGTTATMSSQEMPARIAAIPSGGGGEAPYDINHYYPAKFNYNSFTDEELAKYLKAGGTEGKYTNMRHMFSWTENITTIPVIDTSNVTNFESFLFHSTGLTTLPQLDISKGTNLMAFCSDCKSLVNVPESMDVSNADTVARLFYNCSSLTKLPMLKFGNPQVTLSNICEGCTSLTEIPAWDFNIINVDQEIDFTGNYSFIKDLPNIKAVHCKNIKSKLFNICKFTGLDITAIREIIGNLVDRTPEKPFYPIAELWMTQTQKDLLTPDDLAAIEAKHWTAVVK